MRKMASVKVIDALEPIEGADLIECAVLGGWKVVVKKGEFIVGDRVVYFEIDSWIPHILAPFLSKGQTPREYNGVQGERLKTAKLRGQISQGLVLHIGTVSRILGIHLTNEQKQEDADLTDVLGIQKWEAPVNAQLAGIARGNFPSAIPRTDQERIQNLKRDFETWKGMQFEVTEKLDGSSCTYFLDKEGVFHVCSRNLDLIYTEGNTFWKVALELDIERKMREFNLLGYALQGELVGVGIQGNQYKIQGHRFYLFDVVLEGEGKLNSDDRYEIAGLMGIFHVPVPYDITLENVTISDILALADGVSELNDSKREGLVFKSLDDPSISFKAISNKWLLGKKE